MFNYNFSLPFMLYSHIGWCDIDEGFCISVIRQTPVDDLACHLFLSSAFSCKLGLRG